MRKKQEFTRQTNINTIALDYLKLANVRTLQELEKTIYWRYYQDEIKKLKVNTNKFTSEVPNEIATIKINCVTCGNFLGEKINNIYLLEESNEFKNLLAPNKLVIKCKCGVINNFSNNSIQDQEKMKQVKLWNDKNEK